jgi:hypothetical protein
METEVVNSSKFLGSTIDSSGGCAKEIARRIGLGKAATLNLKKLWRDKNISTSTKDKLIEALVLPIFKYGSESWTVKAKDRSKLQASEHWCWRKLFGNSWTQKRTNQSILNELGIEPKLVREINKQKRRYFGHIMTTDGLEKAVMLIMGEEKKKRKT